MTQKNALPGITIDMSFSFHDSDLSSRTKYWLNLAPGYLNPVLSKDGNGILDFLASPFLSHKILM